MIKVSIILPLFSLFFLSYFQAPELQKHIDTWSESTPVSQVLVDLGDDVDNHGQTKKPSAELIQQGEDIVLRGSTFNKRGKKTGRQSKFFTCTHCHNVVNEELSLKEPNPDSRLDYAIKNHLPFLQGTTLYGAVNRTSWYNDDYYEKYGEAVLEARDDFRKAVQLCATECAQGRALKKWEMDAVIAFLWTLELKMEDLNLNEEEWANLKSKAPEKQNHKELRNWLKKQYSPASPATFVSAYDSRISSEKLEGIPERGQAIYNLSCQHCHHPTKGVTFFKMDESKLTFNLLERHFSKYSDYSIYQTNRFGTQPVLGYKPYMPRYTLERMSEQQMADLRAYIESKGDFVGAGK